MNRYFFKALTLMQFLIFLMFFVSGLYLFAMSKSARVAEFGNASSVERNAVAAIVVSLLFLGPLIGIWRRERWAWWIGIAVNLVCFAVWYWGLIYNKSDVGWLVVIIAMLFLLSVILHLLSRPESWKSIERGDSVLFKRTV